jgi:transposase InsO family protein
MPWRHTSPMDQKMQFIPDSLRPTLSIIELCELYGVRRKTGDKWIERYLKHGPLGLEERSRQPHSSPRQTPTQVVEAVIELRRHHPAWGAKKLLSMLQKRHPSWPLPARSTVCEIFRRNGLVPKKRHRRHMGHPGKPTSQILAPNDVWSADVKGHFTTGNGRYWYPLTVADGYSRFLLGYQALSSTRVQEAKPVFTRLVKAFGLPKRIRTDHGVPFATNTLARLSQLSAWWVRLGILPEYIEPGQPQQNGRHARRHRTLKAETTRPPAAARRAHAIASAKNSTSSAHMKPSICTRQPHALRSRRVRCPPNPRRWNILTDSRCATSVPTGASGGPINGSMFHTPAQANMSASRKLTMASGRSTSARSNAAGCSNDTCASKMPMVDLHDSGNCDPCLRTIVLPISPTGQHVGIDNANLRISVHNNSAYRIRALVGLLFSSVHRLVSTTSQIHEALAWLNGGGNTNRCGQPRESLALKFQLLTHQ